MDIITTTDTSPPALASSASFLDNSMCFSLTCVASLAAGLAPRVCGGSLSIRFWIPSRFESARSRPWEVCGRWFEPPCMVGEEGVTKAVPGREMAASDLARGLEPAVLGRPGAIWGI
jgi:hypothetical protein